MKIVELLVQNVDSKRLLKDAKMEFVRCLMDAGLHGPLHVADDFDAIFWKPFENAGRRIIATDSANIEKLAEGEWDGNRLAFSDAEANTIDDKVGAVLERIDHETVVLMRVVTGAKPSFVLAGPRVPAIGSLKAAMNANDLSATLLGLLGLDPGLAAPGRSILGDAEAPTEQDEEAIVRERLMGLGYLG